MLASKRLAHPLKSREKECEPAPNLRRCLSPGKQLQHQGNISRGFVSFQHVASDSILVKAKNNTQSQEALSV